MNFILLDVDDVLSTNAYSQRCRHEHREPNLFGLDWFAPTCVDTLRRIIEATGAKVVIFSSLRDVGLDGFRKVWESNHMPGELYGTISEMGLMTVDAIQEWIRIHPDDRFVILDVEDLGLPRQVISEPAYGLTLSDASKAINLMNIPIFQTSKRLKTIMGRILADD